jgi:hypothetical protein
MLNIPQVRCTASTVISLMNDNRTLTTCRVGAVTQFQARVTTTTMPVIFIDAPHMRSGVH